MKRGWRLDSRLMFPKGHRNLPGTVLGPSWDLPRTFVKSEGGLRLRDGIMSTPAVSAVIRKRKVRWGLGFKGQGLRLASKGRGRNFRVLRV